MRYGTMEDGEREGVSFFFRYFQLMAPFKEVV